MNHEILSRGKRIDNGEWIEGNLLSDDISDIAAIVTYINLAGDIHDLSECSIYRVIPSAIGRYIGLTDKNGVKIFEGDIVSGYFNHVKVQGVITYGSDATFYVHRDGLYGIGLNNASDWLGVIGNIHDNPELLGGA